MRLSSGVMMTTKRTVSLLVLTLVIGLIVGFATGVYVRGVLSVGLAATTLQDQTDTNVELQLRMAAKIRTGESKEALQGAEGFVVLMVPQLRGMETDFGQKSQALPLVRAYFDMVPELKDKLGGAQMEVLLKNEKPLPRNRWPAEFVELEKHLNATTKPVETRPNG